MIISLIHHHLRKGYWDMFLISQFLGCQIILKNQKKKFLNCFLDVEEYFPKLRFKSKFSFMDPRYEKNDFFWVFWLNIYYGNKHKKIGVFSMPKRTIFLCWLQKKSLYILILNFLNLSSLSFTFWKINSMKNY